MKITLVNNYNSNNPDTRETRGISGTITAALPEEKGSDIENILKNAQDNYRRATVSGCRAGNCPAK